MKNTSWICSMAWAAFLLTACGGGGDGGTVNSGSASDNDSVPASATASPQAFSAYVGSMPADDRAEARDIDNVAPPTSETAEPIDVG